MSDSTSAGQPSLSTGLGRSIVTGGRKRFDRRSRLFFTNRLFRYLCIAAAGFVCLILLAILFLMFRTGILTFNDISFADFFLSAEWSPETDQYGALIFIFGTFALTALTLLISVPISLLIAVFLAVFVPPWLKNMLRPVMDLLVGIPSVVYGYLGLTVLIPLIRQVTGSGMGDGLLAAALVLTIMVLPTISRISDDAISSVPARFRDASYALGATRFQTVWRVLLPSARSGIMYAVILGMARAVGETMAVVMVIGNTAQFADSLLKPTSVLTSNIVMQISNVPFDSTWNYALYLMGFLLLVISIVMIISIRLLQRKGSRA
jgi:phosphate transport system permease protein